MQYELYYLKFLHKNVGAPFAIEIQLFYINYQFDPLKIKYFKRVVI